VLPERCGVVAIPNSLFHDDPDVGRSQVRFAFCKREDVLTEAAYRLQKTIGG
jgi:N-succinyldiaminopimelate aminotransferase